MRFDYTVLGQDGAQLATGFTVLAFMHRDTRRPCKPPTFLRALF
jgi:acyl-CoA thioesterase FadM